MRRAVAFLAARYATDPAHAHWTPTAFAEQVVGLPGRPEPAGGGWWRVGVVLDNVAGEERSVRLEPATGRVRLMHAPQPPPPPEPPRPTTGPWWDWWAGRWRDGDGEGP